MPDPTISTLDTLHVVLGRLKDLRLDLIDKEDLASDARRRWSEEWDAHPELHALLNGTAPATPLYTVTVPPGAEALHNRCGVAWKYHDGKAIGYTDCAAARERALAAGEEVSSVPLPPRDVPSGSRGVPIPLPPGVDPGDLDLAFGWLFDLPLVAQRPIPVQPVTVHGAPCVCVSRQGTPRGGQIWDLRDLYPLPQWQASHARRWPTFTDPKDAPSVPRLPEHQYTGLVVSTTDGEFVIGHSGPLLTSAPMEAPAQQTSTVPVVEEAAAEPKKKRGRPKKESPPDPLTVDNLLRAAILLDPGAPARWAAFRESGLPDGLLLAHVATEWGCGGSLDYGASGQCSYRGGEQPAFWLTQLDQTGPSLDGAALVAAVRRVVGIPLPKDEAEEADLFTRKEGAA